MVLLDLLSAFFCQYNKYDGKDVPTPTAEAIYGYYCTFFQQHVLCGLSVTLSMKINSVQVISHILIYAIHSYHF